jgi:hypothetical protein
MEIHSVAAALKGSFLRLSRMLRIARVENASFGHSALRDMDTARYDLRENSRTLIALFVKLRMVQRLSLKWIAHTHAA